MNKPLRYFKLDKMLPIPLYYQLKQGLTDMIKQGVMRPGSPLPSERELSEAFNISRMTVRQAINELVQDGLVTRLQGKGTFVAEKKVSQSLSKIISFSAMMKSQGFVPKSYVHRTELVKANTLLIEALQLDENSEVLLVERIRLADDKPMVIEQTYLPFNRFNNFNPEQLNVDSLYDLLQKQYDVKPTKAMESIEAALSDAREAKLLAMSENMPVLIRKQVTFDQHNMPFEYVHAIYRGDRYQLVVHSEDK